MELTGEGYLEDSFKTEELPAGALFTSKIAPAFNGRTSWFAYEELIEEFLDITVLDDEKIGPALRSRLIGDAAVYKPLFDREQLKTGDKERVVEYFKSVLRPNFVKGSQHVFLWRFLSLFKLARAHQEMIKWIGRWTVAVKRLKDAWMDLCNEPSDMNDPTYLTIVQRENTNRQATNRPLIDPTSLATFRGYVQRLKENHSTNFPLNDNLMTLVFIVLSDLSEDQRERLVTAMEVRQISLQDYTFEVIRAKYIELFCAPKNSLENPNIRMTGGMQTSGKTARSFLIIETGILDDEHHGFWVQDEETGEEGFIQDTEDSFWTLDENEAWISRGVPGRQLRRGPKGKGKGKKGKGRGFKGRRYFRPYSRRSLGHGKGYLIEEQDDGFDREENGTTQQGFYGKGKKGRKGKGKGGKWQQADAFKGGKGKKGKKGQTIPQSEGANVASEGSEHQDSSTGWYSNDWYADSWWLEDYGETWSGFIVHHISTTMEEHSALIMKSMQHVIDVRKNPTYVVMDLGCTKSMGSRPAIMEFVRAGRQNGLTFEFKPCRTLYAFANSHQSYCHECLVVWFPTNPPCHTEIDILEEGTVPILLSLPQMKNLYMTIHLTPHCEYLTCAAFGLDYTPCDRSTSNHMILDLTELKLNPVNTARTVGSPFKHHVQQSWVAGVSKSSGSRSCPKCGAIGKHECPSYRKDEQQVSPSEDVDTADPDSDLFEDHPYDKPLAPVPTKKVSFKEPSTDGTVTADPEPLRSQPVPPEGHEPRPLPRRLRRYDPTKQQHQQQQPSTSSSSSSSSSKPTTTTTELEEPQPKQTEQEIQEEKELTEAEAKLSLQRLHARLNNKEELLKLHLKHYHMSARQFQLRTSELKLPKNIYTMFKEICDKCETCQKHKPPPTRSRISGLRATEFGDLVFIDHGSVRVENLLFQFMIVLDAATMFIQAYAVKGLGAEESISYLREYMDTYHCTPRTIVSDAGFQTDEWQNFYRKTGIKPLAVGRYTPWPNRAEAAVRSFKKQFGILLTSIQHDPDLGNSTPRELMRMSCYARNTSITYGGKTPVELVYGRRPRDIIDVENATIEQLTTDSSHTEHRVTRLRNLAMKAHLEARQSEDLRRDLASNLRFVTGEYNIGDKCWFWYEDKAKIKLGKKAGTWERVTVIAVEGSMITVNSQTKGVMRINQSKLRKDADEWYDVDLPVLDDSDPNVLPSDRPESEEQVSGYLEYANIMWEVTCVGKIDFLELFSGSARLSAACASTGLKVGPPIDLKTGFNLNSRKGQALAMQLILELEPETVFMAPVCSPWCSWSNMKTPEAREHDRKQVLPMVEFCVQVAWHQIKNGRKFIIENPEKSQLFYQQAVLRLSKHQDVSFLLFDHCQFGMKDPITNNYYKKGTYLMHNFHFSDLSPIARKCTGNHKHQSVEGTIPGFGNRSKLTQVYTFNFCKRLASCLRQLQPIKPRNRQSFLLEDLLDLGQFTERSVCHLCSLSEQPDVLTGTGFSATASDSIVLNLPSVDTTPDVRQRLNVVNALSLGTDVYLHYDWSSLHDTLVPITRSLRKQFFPNQQFDCCRVLRGNVGEYQVPLVSLSATSYVLAWRKRDVSRLFLGLVTSFQWQEDFDPKEWSFIVYYNEGANSKLDDPSDKLSTISSLLHPPGENNPPSSISSMSGLDVSFPTTPSSSSLPEMDVTHPDPPQPPADVPIIALPDMPVFRQPFSRSRSRSKASESSVSKATTEKSMSETDFDFEQDNDPEKSISRPAVSTSAQSEDATKLEKMDADASLRPQISTSFSTPPSSSSQQTTPQSQQPQSQPTPQPQQLPSIPDDDESEEELVPHSGLLELRRTTSTNSSNTLTMESDRTEVQEADLIIFEDEWNYMTEEQKLVSSTGSFSIPTYLDSGNSIDVKGISVTPKVFDSFYASSWSTTNLLGRSTKSDIIEDFSGLCESDRSLLAESLKQAHSFVAANNRSRKEASSIERRQYAKQFLEAKTTEYKSWVDNDVFELIKVKDIKNLKNYVTGRWVLTVKRDKDGNFVKCKARWVLRGFQDSQKDQQQTDSPAATRPGFRLMTSVAATNFWDLKHLDLKTAFLQGETFDDNRNVMCQLPPEAGHPSNVVARMKRPAYGLNDAPRRWFNVVDKHLVSYGLTPTRADRCCYVLYKKKQQSFPSQNHKTETTNIFPLEQALEYLQDPIQGSPAKGKTVSGIICLHVDDLYMTGDAAFLKTVISRLRKDFQVGSEDTNDIEFCGQRIKWKLDKQGNKSHITVDQKKCIDELHELSFDKSLADGTACTPQLHTGYRSVLGMLNWLQSRTQFQIAYSFSRCASAAASPTIGHCRALNKVVRQIKASPVMLHFWPLSIKNGPLRIVAFPDASYRNNEDKSSQMAQVVFICEARVSGRPDVRGTLIDYESHKIKRSTQSTTVAELTACMRSHGHSQFIRGLYMDLTGDDLEIHVRTDANNLVTTAKTTHLPEQKDTIHMITMLRKECNSGSIHDMSHIKTEFMLADSLTKASAKPEQLVRAVESGTLLSIDVHPPFRSLIQHKAYLIDWVINNIKNPLHIVSFFTEDIREDILQCWIVA